MTNMFHTISFKNIIAFVWIIFHSCQSDPHKERHYLRYMFTALTKADTFPEFSAKAESDDKQIAYYSNEKRAWVRKNLTDWTKAPEPPDSREKFLNLLHSLSKSTTGDDHVLQRTVGCKLEKHPNGTVKSLVTFDKYGFDGEDLITFNPDTMKWIVDAKETKKEWDHQIRRNKPIKYFRKTCTDWILTFNNTIKSPLFGRPTMTQLGRHLDVQHLTFERVKPDVFVRKAAADDDSNLVLTCLATGFYPRDIEMYIRLDKTVLENQTSSGIRPNGDEAFQMRISVKIDRNQKGCYDCLLIHSSLTEPVSVEWDGKCFKPEPRWSVIGGVAVLVLALVLILVAALITCCVYKWKKKDGLMRNHPSYGAVSDQIQMTSAASADVIRS